MKFELSDLTGLRPLIDTIVAAAIEQIQEQRAMLADRLAYPEPEAAALLGMESYVLRDARLRGELVGSRVGKRVLYARAELLRFLDKRRIEK